MKFLNGVKSFLNRVFGRAPVAPKTFNIEPVVKNPRAANKTVSTMPLKGAFGHPSFEDFAKDYYAQPQNENHVHPRHLRMPTLP